MKPAFRSPALAVLLLVSCSPNRQQALDVTVSVAMGVSSKCTQVVVSGEGFERRQSMPITLRGRDLKVAVFQEDLPSTVFLQALGFSDEGCTTRTTPAEESTRVSAQFASPPAKVTLLLAPLPPDVDGDGVPSPEDCDDGDPTVRPGLPEVCSDGKDNDCNGDPDCADATCATAACATGARCGGGVCGEEACADQLDNDDDGAADCMDPDCDGKSCGTNGTCVTRTCREPTETLCADNLDNDGDGAADCADPDCDGQACNDGNRCSTGELCASMACGGSTPVVCSTPPGACFSMAGACSPSTGACEYPPTGADAGCDDGNACTLNDACAGDGGCVGTPLVCPAPPSSCFGTGSCQPALDGGCTYPLLTGPCSDNNACTVGDTCGADGGCQSGVLTSCTPPDCFTFTAGSCDADGGCVFLPASSGTACTGGTCNATGVCVPAGTFPYDVDNLNPLNHPAAGGLTINCALTFNSTAGASPPFTGAGCTGLTLPVPTVADGGSAGELVVLSLSNLTITDGGSLTFAGARPVALLVSGDATLNGPLVANSSRTPARSGPGSVGPAGCQLRAGGPGSLDVAAGKGGGGGGAGYFTAGADGGLGNNVAGTGGVGGASATGGDAPLLVGCPGGAGKGDTSNAAGGRGGGALQLSVAGTLTVNAVVSVSGQGGAPGDSNAMGNDPGGGGGGSGGTLNLQALSLVLTSGARLTANGGGGGGGSQNSGAATPGSDGAIDTATPAPGGAQSGSGGPGGAGGAGATPPVKGTNASKGGGGGGGSAGRIFLKHFGSGTCANGASVVSPPAQGLNCP